jgi:hypothetical protein
MTNQRTARVRAEVLVGSAGFAAIAFLLVTLMRGHGMGLTGPGRILAGTFGVAVLVAWWVVFAVRIYRRQDEFGRTGEAVAWHWGGLMGLMASVPVFAFIGMGGLHWLNPASPVGPELARAFRLGYMLPLVMQVAGAVAVGLWWRWSKR